MAFDPTLDVVVLLYSRTVPRHLCCCRFSGLWNRYDPVPWSYRSTAYLGRTRSLISSTDRVQQTLAGFGV